MSAVADEPLAMDTVYVGADAMAAAEAAARNEWRIVAANREASTVDADSLAAFLDLLSGADAEYLDAGQYVPEPPARPLDWDAVGQALDESQKILIGMQNLLSETLAAMGVPEHEHIRVYSDIRGDIRLLQEHPRRVEIEGVLNGPHNRELKDMYHAAMAGMGLAGELVGTMAVPGEAMEQYKRRRLHQS